MKHIHFLFFLLVCLDTRPSVQYSRSAIKPCPFCMFTQKQPVEAVLLLISFIQLRKWEEVVITSFGREEIGRRERYEINLLCLVKKIRMKIISKFVEPSLTHLFMSFFFFFFFNQICSIFTFFFFFLPKHPNSYH